MVTIEQFGEELHVRGLVSAAAAGKSARLADHKPPCLEVSLFKEAVLLQVPCSEGPVLLQLPR